MEILKKLAKKRPPPAPRSVWTNPIHFIACGFGIGLIPIMPGTFGTLVGVLVAVLLSKTNLWIYIGVTLLLNLAGIWLCGKTNEDFKTKDHPAAVWDEIAAFPIVMILIPFTWYYLLLGFILFRFFDIAKPGPIGWIDRHMKGGVGVMLDDVAAAAASWIVLQIILLFM